MSAVSAAENGTTLTDLENYINDPGNSFLFDASIVSNSDGTASLQLTSGTSGSAGTLAVSSSLVDSSTALAYTANVTGSNASLTVDGVNLTSASNTVTNLIPGVTFQLLAPSPEESDGGLEQVQVVIGNDNSGVESTVNQFVTDYNSLISAINAQEGNTSSGTPEPLFGSPTLSLLQQELLTSLNTQNPNGSLDAVTNDLNPTLSGSMTIQVGSGTTETRKRCARVSASSNTIYTGRTITTRSRTGSCHQLRGYRGYRRHSHQQRSVHAYAGFCKLGIDRGSHRQFQHQCRQRHVL